MSNYPNTTLTHAGQDLIAESITEGEALIFTKVVLGDGELQEGQSIAALTALISPKLNVSMTSGSSSGGQVKLRFAVGNSGLDEGFFAREVGIFAKVGENGTETLYAYTNGGNYVDFIPDKTRPIDNQIMDVYIVTGNAPNVTVHISDEAFALAKDLIDHNSNAKGNSHPHQLRPALKRSTVYAKGDICFHDSLPSYAYLECVTAGTTDESEPDFSGVTSGDKVTYGTTVFIIRKIGSLSGFNIGDIKWSSADLTQAGFLVANGAEVGRATYPDLCAVYESVGFPWGAGDGSTTFNLPNLIGKFPEGADSAGGYHEAGLPNITGEFGGWSSTVPTEAFKQVSAGSNGQGSSGWGYNKINFNASRSSSIYGNSTTVQPPSALLIPYVKAFAGASADSTDLAITEVANDVVRISGRVYLVESAVNSDGSWYRKYSDGWLEQGGFCNATSNGVEITVNLLKPMKNTNYTVLKNFNTTLTSGYTAATFAAYYQAYAKTTTSFKTLDGITTLKTVWYACGMGAE